MHNLVHNHTMAIIGPEKAIIGPEKAIIGPEKGNYRTRKGNYRTRKGQLYISYMYLDLSRTVVEETAGMNLFSNDGIEMIAGENRTDEIIERIRALTTVAGMNRIIAEIQLIRVVARPRGIGLKP